MDGGWYVYTYIVCIENELKLRISSTFQSSIKAVVNYHVPHRRANLFNMKVSNLFLMEFTDTKIVGNVLRYPFCPF